MKILQLLCFPLYGSGSGTYVRKLSEALVKSGHEVGIVAPDDRGVKNIRLFTVKLPFMAVFTGHPEYPEAKLYSQLSGAALNDVQAAFMDSIIKAVEEYKPDVIHVHHASNLSWVANYIKAVYQIHYIITSHNTDVINAILDKRYIPLTQDALTRADVITAVSNNTKDRLLKILGKGIHSFYRKTKVVPCGVDTKLFPIEGSVAEVDKKYGLKNKKVVLYSGKITAIKGVDLFIKAAKKFPDAIFVVMGDGDELPAMKNLAIKEKISNVVFTGYLGKEDRRIISQLYRRADLVSVPSTVSEGIPLTALEALSSGTPVVASDTGGIPTAVKHMRNGILVKPKSLSSLVAGIELVLNNKALAQKLGHRGRRDAVDKFDWHVIAKKMIRLYQIPYERSRKNRQTKRASFITEDEYNRNKEYTLIKQEEINDGATPKL